MVSVFVYYFPDIHNFVPPNFFAIRNCLILGEKETGRSVEEIGEIISYSWAMSFLAGLL